MGIQTKSDYARKSGERILLVGSSGGHLAQLLALKSWWVEHDRSWVTFQTPDATYALKDEVKVNWSYSPTTRNIPNLFRNARLARRVLREYRPTIIISTGAGSAVPFFVLGWLMGISTVYLEVFDRIDRATLTGRLCRPFTSLMLVQWEEQLALYRDARLVGRIL